MGPPQSKSPSTSPWSLLLPILWCFEGHRQGIPGAAIPWLLETHPQILQKNECLPRSPWVKGWFLLVRGQIVYAFNQFQDAGDSTCPNVVKPPSRITQILAQVCSAKIGFHHIRYIDKIPSLQAISENGEGLSTQSHAYKPCDHSAVWARRVLSWAVDIEKSECNPTGACGNLTGSKIFGSTVSIQMSGLFGGIFFPQRQPLAVSIFRCGTCKCEHLKLQVLGFAQ